MNADERTGLLKQLPRIDRVLEWPEISSLMSKYSRTELLSTLRSEMERFREDILKGNSPKVPDAPEIAAAVEAQLRAAGRPNLRRVINATGIIIHTNLGRSPLAPEAERMAAEIAAGYSNLEYDLSSGGRGTRYGHVESLLCELTGAESALVVNNNAAAVILALSSMAAMGEVVVSRGELVEIGGSFRVPDVMRQSGARLVEVGTTNRTRQEDYLEARTPETALFLKVHTSNFAIVGFHAEVSAEELAGCARTSGIPSMLDAGSGCLIDLSRYGIRGEPPVAEYVRHGIDVVTFSGDKLLGGPQAGIIAGRKIHLDRMKRHPLLRGFRVDKMTLAALEATLRLYRDEYQAVRKIPVLRMLTMGAEEVDRRAGTLLRQLRRSIPEKGRFRKVPGESGPGGGSFPLMKLPTTLIEVSVDGMSAAALEAGLRRAEMPVIGRIQRDMFLLDPRTLLDDEIPLLVRSLSEVISKQTGNA